MTENQKLREALHKAKAALSLALSDVDWRKDSLTQPVIHKAYNCAHEALALPTAAPVGEREAFEQWWKGDLVDWRGHDAVPALFAWDAWKARAALRAGDAVDAQRYRWLMDNCTLGIKQNGVGWSLNTTACIAPDCIKDVGATIDAAMRKGQL
jgi:hypothetical protein